MRGWHAIAVLFGVLASILAVLSVASFYGYIPAVDVGNLTYQTLAVLAALAVIVAGFAYYEE